MSNDVSSECRNKYTIFCVCMPTMIPGLKNAKIPLGYVLLDHYSYDFINNLEATNHGNYIEKDL